MESDTVCRIKNRLSDVRQVDSHDNTYGYDPESDRIAFEPKSWPEEKRHWVTGSRPFGNISIASTDAASSAMTESAIQEAHRAVNELS